MGEFKIGGFVKINATLVVKLDKLVVARMISGDDNDLLQILKEGIKDYNINVKIVDVKFDDFCTDGEFFVFNIKLSGMKREIERIVDVGIFTDSKIIFDMKNFANAMCMQCGTTDENPKTAFCVNDHDDWIESNDSPERFIEASIKFKISIQTIIDRIHGI